jgi:DNA-binding NtrC family response regulator
MMKILLVCKDPASLAILADELSKRPQVSVVWAESQQAALALIAEDAPQVVVAGEYLADGSAVSLIKEVVKREPFSNCAMVSPLSEEDFHQATEGLGVFMHLPASPGAEEADRMLGLLDSIGTLEE